MHLAQLDIAKLVAPEDDPRVAPFFANLLRITKAFTFASVHEPS